MDQESNRSGASAIENIADAALPVRRGGRALPNAMAWARDEVAALYPGYFALVMATGIISNAFFMQRWMIVSDLLLVVNLVAYPMLWVLTLARVVWFRSRIWTDLTNPRLVFAFFTMVAATDVLGVVVERLTGMRLGEYLAQTLWRPIGMPDTTFSVPSAKTSRLARPLAIDPISGQPQRIPILEQRVKFDGGGGCAFGTVADYLRFGQMLLNGGTIDGERILSPKTVAVMTSNHLGPDIRNNVAVVEPHREGYGFGLGVAVRIHPGIAAVPGSPGDYSWNGATGTAYWADPNEKLVVVLGTAAPGDIRKYYREQLGALVYGAMTELRGA